MHSCLCQLLEAAGTPQLLAPSCTRKASWPYLLTTLTPPHTVLLLEFCFSHTRTLITAVPCTTKATSFSQDLSTNSVCKVPFVTRRNMFMYSGTWAPLGLSIMLLEILYQPSWESRLEFHRPGFEFLPCHFLYLLLLNHSVPPFSHL